MRHSFFLILMVWPLCLYSCGGAGKKQPVDPSPQDKKSLDHYFIQRSFDTLHVHPFHFPDSVTAVNASLIPYEVLVAEKIPLDSGSYQPLMRFFLNTGKTLTGYLLSEQTGSHHILIHLCVYSSLDKKFIFHAEAASYTYLESAMEATSNSWIVDLNNDGVLDIATREFLHDFELPHEDAPNSTGEKSFVHIFNDGKFEYGLWKEGLLPHSRLVK